MKTEKRNNLINSINSAKTNAELDANLKPISKHLFKFQNDRCLIANVFLTKVKLLNKSHE